ncbi:MAG: biotin/lipoyl-binding protein [Turicibacter sp.]
MLKNKKLIMGGALVAVCLMGIAGITFFNKGPQEDSSGQSFETYVIPTQKKIVLNGTVIPSQLKTYTKDVTKDEEVTIHVDHGQEVTEGDLLITYHSQELTDQIKELREDLSDLNAKKSKIMEEGTSSSKALNKQIKAVDDQKTKLKQDTQSQVNKILKQLDEVTKQKSQLNPLDENYAMLVAELDAQIESFYVQKNDLEYNLPTQLKELDDQIIDLKEQLSDADQETFTALDDQIKELSKQISKLEVKELTYEYAPFSGKVSISQDAAGENQQLIKLKSPDFYVSSSVSEKDYAKLKVGMDAKILLLAINKNIKGAITYIAEDPQELATPASGSSASTYAVNVSIEDQADLVNGYQAQVTMKLANELIKVPTSAIVSDGSKHFVYLVTDEGSKEQGVEIVGEEGEYTTIKSGLNEKDEILMYPNVEAKEGETIE